ncbi:cytochrome P450 9e2 [Fopius arisanus]|uniref:CYP9E2_0 protein n=1 Tax=Fopius arisanus TaxID=64838 RepID=A0A0C9R865_9HYME|nr:PREDICTED: cytochrome P450 9e2-like [Fopius arisanus]
MWIIILTLLIVSVITYYLRKPNDFDKRGIIYDKSLSISKTLGALFFRRISIADMMTRIYDTKSDAKYIGSYFNGPLLVIRDPELIKIISIKHFDHFSYHKRYFDPDRDPFFGANLSALNGDKWRDMRTLLSPTFTSSKMKAMFKLMSACAKNFSDYIAKETSEKPVIYNTKDAFTRYTTDVIATCAFGVEVDSMKHPDNEFYVLGKKAGVLKGFVKFKMLLQMVVPIVMKILGIHLLDRKIEKFFTDLVRNTIQTRDREGIVRPDMIQLLMDSRNNEKGLKLDIIDMTAQAFVFFFGGFETSSTIMCFLAHHIADDHQVQRKLQEEIDEVWEACHGDLTYEAINRMEYLDAVVNECLRMYSITLGTDRICTKEFELPPALPGMQLVLVKPGEGLWFPIYAIHRDPKYFNDPNKFIPERFIDHPRETLHSPAFIPFGSGPRMCIGNRFATLEIKVVIFYLMLKCSLRISDKMIMPLEFDKSNLNLGAEGGFWLDVMRRSK